MYGRSQSLSLYSQLLSVSKLILFQVQEFCRLWWRFGVVLLRISKCCKRMDSDGFFKKSADPDSVSDSGWKYYKHVFTDVWFGIHTSNGRKWHKSIPLADNKHCYVVVVVYLWVSENGVSAILMGFWWYKFEKWGEKNFWTVIFGRQKSEDLDSDELGKSSRIRTQTRNP